MHVVHGAAATVESCRFSGNASMGIGVHAEGSHLLLERSLLSDTLEGGGELANENGEYEFILFGDGLSVGWGSSAEVRSSVIRSNTRTGAYFMESGGTIVDSIITGGASYGLAMVLKGQTVAWEEGGNHILGNALDLPLGFAVQVTTDPGGLPFPPPPEVSVPADPGD